MALTHANELDPGTQLETDICIVGAGAAGIALASELDRGPLDVCLLEGGGKHPAEDTERLNEMDVVGHPLNRHEPPRLRCFGGTTHVTYGRCVLFDEIDLKERPWVKWSGWPLGESDISPFYSDAARILRVPAPEALHREYWKEHFVCQQFEAAGLTPSVNLWARNIDMGKAFIGQLRRSRNINVVLGANVTGCLAGDDRRVIDRMEVRALNGNRLSVRAHVFVLACGGLETPRVLLLSAQNPATAPAMATDALGRYYMNHPRTEDLARLRLNPDHPARRKLEKGLVMHRSAKARGRIQFMLRPDDRVQRDEQLLNSCSFFYAVSDERARRAREAWNGLMEGPGHGRSHAATLRHTGRVMREIPTLLAGAAHRAASRPFRIDHLVTVDQSEQVPDPESRISLSDQIDRFGKARIRLDWRIGPETTRTLRRLHELIANRVRELGIGRLESHLLDDPDYEPNYADCAHPMGATRMSVNPRFGVTDRDCLVHGTRNLYVAGNSLFPAGGYANPTFTIVALAARLARHLARHLAPPSA